MSGRLIALDKKPGISPVGVGGNLAADDGKMPAECARTGDQGSLWDDSDCMGSEGRDIGRHPCDARPLGGAKSRRGLGISPP